jgi:uncharacterized membrane protein
MVFLAIGVISFFGMHSLRIFASAWRERQIARIGLGPYKGLYSLGSAAGLALIVWGYGLARASPIVVFTPPVWTRHAAVLLMLFAFVLLAAPYVPKNHIKARLGHPMILGVKLWAFAHLIANGTAADVLLFGSALAWAILDFRSARLRDRKGAPAREAGGLAATIVTILAGVSVWAAFVFWLHAWLIGVAPLG